MPPPPATAPVAWSDAALALFGLTGPTAVTAGAGSGKTTALVELCLRLLSGEALGAPCEPEAIAAITFTEKAAEELAERIRAAVLARLGAARDAGDAGAWAARLEGLDRMAVGTIHGFCGRLLREHAPEAGLDPEFEVAEEELSGGWLREAALGAVLAALDRGDPGTSALCAGMGAAAGRGALVDAVIASVKGRAWRGAEGDPEPVESAPGAAEAERARLLAAAREIVARRGAAPTPGASRAIEALARALEDLPAGDEGGPLEAGSVERLAALGMAVGAWRRSRKDDGGLWGLREELVAAASRLPPLAAEGWAGDQKRALCALVGEAERRYAAAKREARALDFDDLLILARDLLLDRPSLRAELRGRFRALLVDEYQDVNPVQRELLELVAGPGEPPGPIPVAVGDLKQSIYRFRGADVSVFAGLVTGYEAGGGRVLALSENHRSLPAILAFANAVSALALQPAGGAPRPYELRFGPRDALVPRRAGGPATAVELLVDGGDGDAGALREREARAIAARIAAIVDGRAGVAVRERGEGGGEAPRRPRPGDVAILLRRLTHAAVYERALREAGLPCRLARGGGFYQAPEVRDLGELLASLAEPGDAVAWAALLRSPLCAVSDADLLALAGLGLPTLHRLGEAELRGAVPDEAAAGRLLRFLDAWRSLRSLRDRAPLEELLRRAVEALDVDAALLAAPEGERRLQNVGKALALAARLDRAGCTAAEAAAHFRQQAVRPPREPEADTSGAEAVAILTIHQAKGLEWPVVVVPDLGGRAMGDSARFALTADGRLTVSHLDPARGRWTPTASLLEAREEARRAETAESRRLLYVALTRARDWLVLSGEGAGREEPTWRGLVDAALSMEPALARRVAVADAASDAAGPPLGGEPALPPPPPPRPLRLASGPAPIPVRMAVTDLAEYARCPRRHRLGRVLGLEEPREGGGRTDDDPARATDRGTLAHALLAEADLDAPPLVRRAQAEAVVRRRGYDPSSPAVRRIVAEVGRFVDSGAGRELSAHAARGALLREVPFLLRLDGVGGEACYLVGAIDALAVDARRRTLTVVDFKYAVARPGAAERYRLQLLAYALAASRAHPGYEVRARVQFLRGDARAVDLTPAAADVARFAAEAPALAAAAARGGGEVPAAALGRTPERCRADGCGWVARCHGGLSPGMPLPAAGGVP